MIPLEIRPCHCEPWASPAIAVVYPTRLWLEVVLEHAARLREAPLRGLDIHEVRFGPFMLPCLDVSGRSLLARTEIVVEGAQVWWTGYELYARELRDRWETVPIALQDFECSARERQLKLHDPSRLLSNPCDAEWEDDVICRVLRGEVGLPGPDGKALTVSGCATALPVAGCNRAVTLAEAGPSD
jgi:hypothetical protein